MAHILSWAHISMVLTSHRNEGEQHTVDGFADEDRPIEFPSSDDMADLTFGHDGALYGTAVPMYGGEVTIRLNPTSPSTQWFIDEREAWKQANLTGGIDPIPTYSGTYTDSSQNRTVRMEGGVMLRCPHINEPGVTFEVVIVFEQIVSSVGGAYFGSGRDGIGTTPSR